MENLNKEESIEYKEKINHVVWRNKGQNRGSFLWNGQGRKVSNPIMFLKQKKKKVLEKEGEIKVLRQNTLFFLESKDNLY